MPATNLKIVVEAIDRASAELRKIQGSLNNVGKEMETTSAQTEAMGVSFQGLFANIASGVTIANLATNAILAMGRGLKSFLASSFEASMATERLQATIYVMGQNTGRTREEIDNIVTAIREENKSMKEALEITQGIIEAELNEEQALKLLAAARNVGAATGKSSSEVNRIILTSMLQMQPTLLSGVHLTFSLVEATERYRKEMDIVGRKLTIAERQQAVFNQAMREAEKFSGAYDEAMKTSSKLLGSVKDAFVDVKTVIGDVLDDAFAPILRRTLELIRAFRAWAYTSNNELNPQLQEMANVVNAVLGVGLCALTNVLHVLLPIMDNLFTRITNITKKTREWGAEYPELAMALGTLVMSLGGAVAIISTLWFVMDKIVHGISGMGITIAAINPYLFAFVTALTAMLLYGDKIVAFFDYITIPIVKLVEATDDLVRSWMTLAETFERFVMKPITKMFTMPFEALKWVGKKIGGVLGFQNGGVVPGAVGEPMMAMVHGGERITPPGRGFGNINITITGNTISSEMDIREIGDRIWEMLAGRIKANAYL